MTGLDRAAILDRASRHSPFLAMLSHRHGDVAARFLAGHCWSADPAENVSSLIDVALRHQRARLALGLALDDLSGNASLTQVTRTLSDFADDALDRTIRHIFAELLEAPSVIGFTVIALGKLGSYELNYSSDIDIILLFDPASLPRYRRDDAAQTALRIGRRLVDLIAQQTDDGRVFRVDLRLRPAPEVTPIVLPVNAAISHYESQAIGWERAAFIRARGCAGDANLSRYFLNAVQPFVWRRALDFGQARELGAMSERIRDHFASGQAMGPGFDLKRGRGGIREIEFFGQVHQLVHGGRNPALRLGDTRAALAALADATIIPAQVCDDLTRAYVCLRTIEHRLQMVDDRQTHELPQARPSLDNVARLHGLADGEALIGLLAPQVERAGAVYDGLIDDSPSGPRFPVDADHLERHLAGSGFADPARVGARVSEWRSGRVPALRSEAGRAALETLLPDLLNRIGAAPNPDVALTSFDRIVCGLPSSLGFFRLLAARPQLLDLLVDILVHAPTLADDLANRSDLMDGLIAPQGDDAVRDLRARLDQWTAGDRYETKLDKVRQAVGEERFSVGIDVIAGGDPLVAAKLYASIAGAALDVLARATIDEFVRVHGVVPDSELVVLALGRLGGEALTHASDLDLVFLFTGPFNATSDGTKPLGATLYYNRLAQRIVAALGVATASGKLYEIDTRLRPSGSDGPLCITVESFLEYQKDKAWTWEHMALCRARVVFGSDRATVEVENGIVQILEHPRDRAQLIADAVKMRAEMADHKPPKGPFDAKLMEGGLVDLEFAVHIQQLVNRAGFDPRLDCAVAMLVEQGLAPDAMIGAHDLLTRLLVTLRLMTPDMAEPAESSRVLIARACGSDDWADLVARLGEAQRAVRDWWNNVTQST